MYKVDTLDWLPLSSNAPKVASQGLWSETCVFIQLSDSQIVRPKSNKSWTSSYWTAMSSFCFLTSGQHEGGNLGPKLHPGGGFFGP